MDDYKMVILMRTDLGMSKGKLVAQGAHVAVINALNSSLNEYHMEKLNAWMNSGMKKIALKVASQEELEQYIREANNKGLMTSTIRDFGLTQVEPDTMTCGAIGPNLCVDIDAVVGNLKLL